MLIAEALKIVGQMSQTRKMPGYSYGLSSKDCKRGSILAKQPGTTCSVCYANKGHYMWPDAKECHQRRLKAIDDPRWANAMILILKNRALKNLKRDTKCFRWHDSGDLQSMDHLLNIIHIALKVPEVKFRMPTRELSLIENLATYLNPKDYDYSIFRHWLPPNLLIRISADKPGEIPVQTFGLPIATVTLKNEKSPPGAFVCPAGRTRKTCEKCRACWSKRCVHVDYVRH